MQGSSVTVAPVCVRVTCGADKRAVVATYEVVGDNVPQCAEAALCGVGTSLYSSARQRWVSDINIMKRMNLHLYANEIEEAERICRVAMHQPPPPSDSGTVPTSDGAADCWRDSRGIFAMLCALFHAMVGMAQMERDNLSRSLPALFQAHTLLSEVDPPWVASQLARGVCEATIGALQCAQYHFVAGGWHLLRAYSALRHVRITELLNFPGMERAEVRSLALFFLGTKGLVLELLPPAAARWLPGIGGAVARAGGAAEALSKLRTCAAEDSLFSLSAMDVLLGYHVGLKPLLAPLSAEPLWDASGWAEADGLVCRAEALVGCTTSLAFGTKAAALLGWRRRPAHAAYLGLTLGF